MMDMRRKLFAVLALLCVVCLCFSAGFAEEQPLGEVLGMIEQGAVVVLTETPLVPEDFSGFQLTVPKITYEALEVSSAYSFYEGPDLSQAVVEGDMVTIPLDEEYTRRLLERGDIAGIGPDKTILWNLHGDVMTQHGKNLVLMFQSSVRGVPDTEGSLQATLKDKLQSSFTLVNGDLRWSPDGRFLFFNDTNRWYGQQKLDDPYLWDTRTGEIFLIEGGVREKTPGRTAFRHVLSGDFSMDGKYFFYGVREYNPEGEASHYLMRYDLESGETETALNLSSPVLDLCETAQGRWFLLESGESGEATLTRMTVSTEGCSGETSIAAVPKGSYKLYRGAEGKALLALYLAGAQAGTYLVPLDWDNPSAPSAIYGIRSIYESKMHEYTAEDVEAAKKKAFDNRMNLTVYPETAYIVSISDVPGTSYLLLSVELREEIPDSWANRFNHFTGLLLMNAETMEYIPCVVSDTEAPEGQTVRSSFFVSDGNACTISAVSPEEYAARENVFRTGRNISSRYGYYRCQSESDPLILVPTSLEEAECKAEITAGDDGYEVTFEFVSHPKGVPSTFYLVPEVLTVERYREVTSRMTKKNQKHISSFYYLVGPDTLDTQKNRDELLAAYPLVATEEVYVLRADKSPSNLEKLQSLFTEGGYTMDDYNKDLEIAAVPRKTNVIVEKVEPVSYPVQYTFSGELPEYGRVLELAGLCDRIGAAAVSNMLDESPVPAGSLVADRYDLGGTVFSVEVRSIEEEGNTLRLTVTVTP